MTFAISFPVGSLGEEFGWRGIMAPYLNTLLDQRFGSGKFWKWTPLLQSLITGVFWAVGALCLRSVLCLTACCAAGVARAGVLCRCRQPEKVQFLAVFDAGANVIAIHPPSTSLHIAAATASENLFPFKDA